MVEKIGMKPVNLLSMFAQNAQICLTVAFSGKNALKCLLHWLWWPRVLCLQQMHKSASLLLSTWQKCTEMHTASIALVA